MKNHNGANKRVLIVEDEPAISEMCRRILVGEGFEVCIAGNGKMAQEMIATEDYDLCLIDIRTPVIDGQELYVWLLQEYPEVASRVIFTTGEVMGGDAARFMEYTTRPFLHKPFGVKELKTMVGKVLFLRSG